MHFHWYHILMYSFVPLIIETVIQITNKRDDLTSDEEFFLSGALVVWPLSGTLLLVAGTFYGLVLLYLKYVVKPLQTKYKKYQWEKKNNAELAKQRRVNG